MAGLVVTLISSRTPQRREAGVVRRTGWGRRRLPADVLRLVQTQARAVESLPYSIPGLSGARLSTIYVRQQVESVAEHGEERPTPLRDEQPGGTRRQRRSRIRPAAQPIERVLGRDLHMVIEGGAGMGKSTLARDVTARLARSWLTGAEAPTRQPVVPLLVSAEVLSRHLDQTWTEALTAASAEFGLHADGACVVDPRRTDLGEASWLIIIDGMDEMPEPQRHKLAEVLAERMTQPAGRMRLMVLTRPLPKGSRQRLRVAAGGTYTILPFTQMALREFVGKAIAASSDSDAVDLAARFLHELRRIELDDVATTPLLASIALTVYLSNPGWRLPSSRRELYERYLAHLNQASTDRRVRLRGQLRRRLSGVAGGAAAASALHARYRDLVEHLAVRRVVSDDPLDDAAVEWCRNTGIAPSEVACSHDEADDHRSAPSPARIVVETAVRAPRRL